MKRTMDYLSPFISDMKIILNRCFFSLDNLRLLSGIRYIIAFSLTRMEIKSVYSKT